MGARGTATCVLDDRQPLRRYGGGQRIAARGDKIANGQCIFVRRDAYESVGGHAAVREHVAEDVALAQHLFASGKRTALILGHGELTTRL